MWFLSDLTSLQSVSGVPNMWKGPVSYLHRALSMVSPVDEHDELVLPVLVVVKRLPKQVHLLPATHRLLNVTAFPRLPHTQHLVGVNEGIVSEGMSGE